MIFFAEFAARRNAITEADEPAAEENSWKGALLRLIAQEAGVEPEDILGTDLFLTTRMAPSVWGMDGEYLSAQRLDDLECCYSLFRGFLAAGESSFCGTEPADSFARKAEMEDFRFPDAGILPMFCVFDT